MDIELAAEALVAVTGLYPSKPISDAQAAEAVKIPKDTADAVKNFLDGKGPRRSGTSKLDYLKTWKKLNTKASETQLVQELRDRRIADAYLAKLKQARAYLRDSWRPIQVDTLMGKVLLDPPLSENQRCSDLYALVNDPRVIHSRMSVGYVANDEMNAMRTVYPEFVAMIDSMIDALLFQRRKERRTYQPPWSQETAIRMFRGQPTGAPMDIINPEKPPESKPPEIKIGVNSKAGDMTRADRAGGDVPAQ